MDSEKINDQCYCCGECENLFRCGDEINPAKAKQCNDYKYRGYCKCMELCDAYNSNDRQTGE